MYSESTIGEEITNRKIEPDIFDTTYKFLEKGRLPPESTVRGHQRALMMQYLRDEDVLDEDGKIQNDALKLFIARKKLEDSIHIDELLAYPSRGSFGGVLPCSNIAGGVLPCRSPDSYVYQLR